MILGVETNFDFLETLIMMMNFHFILNLREIFNFGSPNPTDREAKFELISRKEYILSVHN